MLSMTWTVDIQDEKFFVTDGKTRIHVEESSTPLESAQQICDALNVTRGYSAEDISAMINNQDNVGDIFIVPSEFFDHYFGMLVMVTQFMAMLSAHASSPDSPLKETKRKLYEELIVSYAADLSESIAEIIDNGEIDPAEFQLVTDESLMDEFLKAQAAMSANSTLQ